MRILITGSRNWTDVNAIHADMLLEAVTGCWNDMSSVTVMHGGCPTGADAIADRLARQLGFNVFIYPADWEGLGKAAGPTRNKRMVEECADYVNNGGKAVVLAFRKGKSRGTTSTIKFAEDHGLTIRIREEA